MEETVKTVTDRTVPLEFQHFCTLFPQFLDDIQSWKKDRNRKHGIILTFKDRSKLSFYYTQNGRKVDWHLTTEVM